MVFELFFNCVTVQPKNTKSSSKGTLNVICITNSKIATLTTFVFFSNCGLNSLQAAFYRYSPACPCITFLYNPETLSLSQFTFKIFEVYCEKGKQISEEFFLFSLVWSDWVLFVNGSIVIGWDEVIREYCTRSNRTAQHEFVNLRSYVKWSRCTWVIQ